MTGVPSDRDDTVRCLKPPNGALLTGYLFRRLNDAWVTVSVSDLDINRVILLTQSTRAVDGTELPPLSGLAPQVQTRS